MANLSLIDSYDVVLNALYDISGKRPTEGRILAHLRAMYNIRIDRGELWDLFLTMRQQGYLHPPVTDPSSKIPTEIIHLISFAGKKLKEEKGLAAKIAKEKPKWHQEHPILYALMSAIGGAILALIVGLILWRVDKQSKNQENQEIRKIATDANHKVDSLISVLKNR